MCLEAVSTAESLEFNMLFLLFIFKFLLIAGLFVLIFIKSIVKILYSDIFFEKKYKKSEYFLFLNKNG